MDLPKTHKEKNYKIQPFKTDEGTLSQHSNSTNEGTNGAKLKRDS